jgi:transposase
MRWLFLLWTRTVQGGRSCPVPLVRVSFFLPNSVSASRRSLGPVPLPRPWLSAAALSSSSPLPIAPPTRPPLRPLTATGTPSDCGGNASPKRGWTAFRTPHGPADRRFFPPQQRVAVLSLASDSTADHDCPTTRWSLDDLARQLVNEAAVEAMSRSTVWRILDSADLKPHRSVYWLNSHDPDFDAKAKAICALYVQSPTLYQHGELVICMDEKTGMQILQRLHPTQLARPGQPEKREHEYIRHGTRALLASFVVPTGEVVWGLGETRTSDDFAAHLLRVVQRFHSWSRLTWVMDNLNTHWSLQACEVLAALNGRSFGPRALKHGRERRAFLSDPDYAHRFVFTPKHGSWLNQVELWFSVLARRFLKRGDFASAAEFEERLRRFLEEYNEQQAHPYRWTYTGEPLVRATPFSQTRRQQRQGRAWFGQRPRCWERFLYPPRPYNRRAA